MGRHIKGSTRRADVRLVTTLKIIDWNSHLEETGSTSERGLLASREREVASREAVNELDSPFLKFGTRETYHRERRSQRADEDYVTGTCSESPCPSGLNPWSTTFQTSTSTSSPQPQSCSP